MQRLNPKAVWLFFVQMALVSLFFLVFLSIFLLSLVYEVLGDNSFLASWAAIIFLLAIVFSYVWARLTYRFWRYEFDKEAVKIEKGVVWKKYISIPYGRIQNVDIYRGVLARLLGLSDLQIQTAGYSSHRQHGRGSEGRLPGLDIQTAEKLRDELIKKVKDPNQGL